MKRLLLGTALGSMLALGSLAMSAGPAAASIVCNRDGDCWHVDHREHYAPNLRVEIHPDDWYFHRHWDADKDHHWREYHEGRGYYEHGQWVPR